MTPLAIPAFTVTTALGQGIGAQLDALRNGRSGLRAAPFEGCGLNSWTGVVDHLDQPLAAPFQDWDCRNNRLAELGLRQDGFFDAALRLRQRHGAARIGLFIGSSTAGVHQTEGAYRERGASAGPLPDWFCYRTTQNMYSVADYVRLRLGLDGISLVISTACSSSAKVFASAQRAIAAGFCDAAIVGGVDSLCQTTLYGFNSLQLLSSEPCRPADVARNGISIGEAAGFAILEPGAETSLALLGYGESSDAWHMSAPEPDGRGAFEAMTAALQRASLETAAVDYINLHGTATPANDLAESRAVCRLFGSSTACSSTKGWTGHTLGAAGIVEAVLSLLCLEHGLIPRSLNTVAVDPAIEAGIALETRTAPLKHVLSNSFGFGGSNASLLFGRCP